MASVSSRAERLERYMRRKDVYFIGDKKKKIYHNKDCEGIEFIVMKNLCSCGPVPENAGFKPCPVCKPVPVDVSPEKVKKDTASKDSRKEALQAALSDLACRHNIHIKFKGPKAYITTIAGEWFFNYMDTNGKIRLYHKNNEQYHDAKGDLIPGAFHIQEGDFTTSLSVVNYIVKHEKAAENRSFIEKATQISSRVDEETGLEVLYLGQERINHRDIVTALFPSGWENVRICFRDCERTGPKWYIMQFGNYSPVGLFATNLRRAGKKGDSE